MSNAIALLDVVLDERDSYTRNHCHRLVSLSEKVGMLCDLDSDSLQLLRKGALLHDLGKVGIPDAVLLKASSLSPDEWAIMQSHSERGERILRESRSELGEQLCYIVRNHHEHFDGNGYPDGLAGEDIPIHCRIISVVDSYDAMTSHRVYSTARSHEEAIAIMSDEEGEKSDPYIFRKFLAVIGNGQVN